MHDIAAISIDSGYKKKQILYRTGAYLHFDTDGNWYCKGKNNTFFSFNRMDSRNDDGYDESMDKWKKRKKQSFPVHSFFVYGCTVFFVFRAMKGRSL